MRDLPACRHQQYSVFTSAQAQSAGLTRHALRGLIDRGRLLALRRGVYVDAAELAALTLDDRARAQAVAACLAYPLSVLSHQSARLIHRLPALELASARPTVTIAGCAGRGGRRGDMLIYTATLPHDHLERRQAWAVTSAARTVCDLARSSQLLPALVALDSALSRGLCDTQQLQAVAEHCAGWPGSQRLRDVMRRADAGAESPYETVARLHVQDAGLEPCPQVWAFDAQGPIGCGDLWIGQLWTYLEVDGDVKYVGNPDGTSLLVEKRRQERLEDAGFGVARVSAKETRDADLLVRRIERAAARGRLTRAANAPIAGYIGPPPFWAKRGARVPVARAPM